MSYFHDINVDKVSDDPSVDEETSAATDDLASIPNGNNVFGSLNNEHGSELAWSLLSVEHKGKRILENATGRAKPGQLTALMGHSGSGKTSLLKAITGRGPVSSGKVLLSGTQADPGSPWFQKRVPFVADRETVEATATCVEVITFSASLRLPSDTSTAATKKLVSEIIATLKLESCAHTQCRHLSAGERRRLSVAVELVVRPKTLVLDEPTSGLDSFHGVVLMQCLKQVASGGTTVLLSIHHPNLLMWEMMDHVILLHKGKVMVQGTGVSIVDTFERHGYQVPPNENPADWIMTISQTHTAARAVMSVDDAYLPSTGNSSRDVTAEVKEDSPTEDLALADNNRVGPLKECSILLAREWNRAIRDTDAMFPRFLLSIVGGAAFAIVFAGVADGNIDSLTDLSAHAGSLFFLFLCASIVAPSIMMDAIKERPIFEREYRTGHYRMWTYILCKTITDALVLFAMSVCISSISFYAVGFQGRFWYLLLLYFVFGWVFTLIAVIIVAASKDPTSSVDYVGFIFLPMALLSGFYVPVSELPSWLQWAPWTMPFTWAFRLALEEEFAFCATPSERDGHLLKCIEGLEKLVDNSASALTENTEYTLEQTGEFEGIAGIQEYTELASTGGDPTGHLFYDTCSVKNTFDIIINSVSETQCNLTAATMISGRVNPAMTAEEDLKFQAVNGNRLEYTMSPEGDVVLDKTAVGLGNPKDDLLNLMVDQTKVSEGVCDTLENICGSEFYSFDNRSQCVSAMETLPHIQVNDRGVNTFTGNSTGCRMVHNFLAMENDDHCAHISWPRQADPNENFKCVDDNIHKSYFDFTEEEDNMFQQVSNNFGIFDTKRGRAFVSGDRGECAGTAVSPPQVLSTLQRKGELEDINAICYGYLQQNDATSEYTAVYWSALFGAVVFARVATGFFMRFQAHRRD